MTCGSCGEKNRDGARFCAECGAALERSCADHGDWDTVRASMTPDFVFASASGVTGPGSGPLGRDEYLVTAQSFSDAGTARTTEVLATRGERLALTRFTLEVDGVVIEMYGLHEIDGEGRFSRINAFEDGDLDRARAELDTWWFESLDEPALATLLLIADVTETGFAGDRDRLERLFTEDFTFIDHGVWLFNGFGRSEVIEGFADPSWSTEGAEVERPAIPRLTGRGAVGQTIVTSADGSTEWRWCALYRVADGRISHLEYFREHDLAAAVARFDELSTEPPV